MSHRRIRVQSHVPGPVDGRDPYQVERWGWVEAFVAIQLLWDLWLFIPGMQPYRLYIRALPYVASLGSLVVGLGRARMPTPVSGRWLLAVFALLAANLLHAQTHLAAGIAQFIFQISIAAPLFWIARSVRTPERLSRLLWIVSVASVASAGLGVLQVYYPDTFLPPEFSILARTLNPEAIAALTYVGPGGRPIIRPPGISDMPGGAALAGLAAVLLGIVNLANERHSWPVRLFGAAMATIGMTALYLTQVRSVTIVAALSALVLTAVRLRQGKVLRSAGIVACSAALVILTFMWAKSIGGQAIETRFSSLIDTGILASYQQNRGVFLESTLNDLLFQFPFGAGLGRWGMMQIYFPDPTMVHAPPLYVEIQITGWLLDGGFLMWICYGGALASACRTAYAAALDRSTPSLSQLATTVFAFQIAVIGLCFSAPVFNAQLGVVFWSLTGALAGVLQARTPSRNAGARPHRRLRLNTP